MPVESKTAESRYKQLERKREPYLRRARDCAALTIPGLFPPLGSNETTDLPTSHQSVGADGVNNLSAKLLLALLPPNSPFFRLRVDESVVIQLQQQDPAFRAEIEKALSLTEQAIMADIETSGDRTVFFEASKHLLIAGNVLLLMPKDSGMRLFRLDKYVIKRTPDGKVLEIITRETTSPDALPKNVRALINQGTDQECKDTETVDIYTHIKRNGNHWRIYQEIKGKLIPGSEGSFPLDKSPYIPLRFERIDGEDYGRSYVEQYYGDLKSLEGLEKSINEGSAAAAKILVAISPNGTARAKDVQKAENGDVILADVQAGAIQDIAFLQSGKASDFGITFQAAQNREQRLQRAFLLFSAVQRDAERVTAEEVRKVIGELEERLGGFYSILAQEFQAPYLSRKMHVMQQANRLPVLPKDIVKPAIVTGLEALGRSQNLQKLQTLGSMLMSIFGAQAIAERGNIDVWTDLFAAALSMDAKGLMKTQEQIAQEQAQARQDAMMQQVAGPAIQAGGKLIQEGMKSNGQQ